MKVKGIVIKGKNKSKKLGFPTANIEMEENLESGVYSGMIMIGQKEYKCAIFKSPKVNLLEAHILYFSGYLYGQEIEVEILEKIREVEKFSSDDELKRQIEKDIDTIKHSDSHVRHS